MKIKLFSRSEVCNHISKPLALLVKARIALIPKRPGSDWRDLPNTIWKFPSGDLTEPIDYCFVFGFSDDDPLQFKGVCSCMIGPKMRCEKATYMQTNTIIITNRRQNYFIYLERCEATDLVFGPRMPKSHGNERLLRTCGYVMQSCFTF